MHDSRSRGSMYGSAKLRLVENRTVGSGAAFAAGTDGRVSRDGCEPTGDVGIGEQGRGAVRQAHEDFLRQVVAVGAV